LPEGQTAAVPPDELEEELELDELLEPELDVAPLSSPPDEAPPSSLVDPLELPLLELVELPDPLLDDEPFEPLLPEELDAPVVESASSAPPSPAPEPVGSLSVVPSTP
jgi:hypothetical protein